MFRSPYHTRLTVYLLLTITLVLLGIDIAFNVRSFLFNLPDARAWMFYFDRRMNVPFFFALGLLLIATLQCYQLGTQNPSQSGFWYTLMILTGLIALSKLLHLHNKIRTFTSGITGAYDPSTVMYYVWALPYLFIVGYIFIKLGASVNSVAREIRKPLSVAAMLFFTGAIALELAGLAYARTHEGSPDIYHSLIKTLEELLQLLGSIALISILGAQMSAQQQACERSA